MPPRAVLDRLRYAQYWTDRVGDRSPRDHSSSDFELRLLEQKAHPRMRIHDFSRIGGGHFRTVAPFRWCDQVGVDVSWAWVAPNRKRGLSPVRFDGCSRYSRAQAFDAVLVIRASRFRNIQVFREPFLFICLPFHYKARGWHRWLLYMVSIPIRVYGRLRPGVFSFALLIVVSQ